MSCSIGEGVEMSSVNPHFHSVSQYITGLRAGEENATQKIWERFYERLIRLAAKKILTNKKASDEDDIVQEAFAQFFRGVENGRFPILNDREDLWQVLAMLVDRRAIDQARREHAEKRGGGNVHTESFLMQREGDPGIAGIPCPDPTPELVNQLSEIFRDRLSQLDDESYRQLALLKLQGFTNQEIAEKTGRTLRTVERRLRNIRDDWSAEQD